MGNLKIFDETLSLNDINLPIFVVATHTDHIAPWKSSFYGLNKTKGPKKFILAGSGHIAGIINPVNSKKYGYWSNDNEMITQNEWFYSAKKNEGSWWKEWKEWITMLSGNLECDNNYNFELYPKIEQAPGSYVKRRYK